MPYKKEDDDDLFDDDFEFVDDEDEDEYDEEEADSEVAEEEVEEAPKPKRGGRAPKAPREPAPKAKAKPAPKPRGKAPAKPAPAAPADEEEFEEVAEEVPAAPELEPAGPPADHVVHIYEFRKFKRTIARDFTSEDADKFATEYNRTSANHSRWAVSGGKDAQPAAKI